MSLILPYPGKPANGDALDASVVQANIQAIAQAIQSFDASQISPGTLTAAAFAASINPNTILKETIANFIQTGLVWSIVSGLQGTMSGGTIYQNGLRVTVGGVGSYTFTASQDTYIDVDYNGNMYYLPVSNGGTAPALTANAQRVAVVYTNATQITGITQNGIDGIGNVFSNSNPMGINKVFFPTLQNGWTNYGGGFGPPFYAKNKAGTVFLGGLIKGGTTAGTTVIMNLPAGFRPPIEQLFNVRTAAGTAALDVFPGGNVTVEVPVDAGYTALNGISFQAAG